MAAQGSFADLPPGELRSIVDRRTWFHTIDLAHGVVSPGAKDTRTEVEHMHIPEDLSGLRVLDVGVVDGFYSFEAERRGAADVLATDSFSWTLPGSDARANFDLAHDVLDSRVRAQEIAVEYLSPDSVGGPFDLVLFLGVLYHAPNPLGYLQNVRSVTSGFAIIETVVDLLEHKMPALAYYPRDQMNEDPSNFFGPNPKAVEAMLMDAGFDRVVSFAPWATNPEWGVERRKDEPIGPLTRLRHRLRRARSGRMVFHAYV